MTLPPWFDYSDTAPPAEKRATIIGGGLAGTSVAAALASRGWDITLIERNAAPALEASGNPSGVVMPAISRKPNPASHFSSTAFQFALEHFQTLHSFSTAPLFHPVGVIQVSDKAPEYLRAVKRDFKALHARVLDLAQFQSVTGLDAGRRALYFPTAGWGSPAHICAAQIAAHNDRINVLSGSEVIHLQRRDNGWSVFNRETELPKTPVVIIANGVDVNRFPQTAAIDVTPTRGQISFIATSAFEKSISNVICSNRGYVIPDRQDTMSIGATYERDATNTDVTQYSHRENLRNLQSLGVLGSGYTDSVLGGRAAVRTTTRDRLPILGGVPDFQAFEDNYGDVRHGKPLRHYSPASYHSGLYIAAGFGSRGITHCPYSGELLARLICGELGNVERGLLALLHPGRFEIRRMKKVQPVLEEEIGAVI